MPQGGRMLDPFTLGDALKLERKLLDERLARQATWTEHRVPSTVGSSFSSVRRYLARALLALADRLDPRAVVTVPHMPARPTLNGTPHHA